MCFYINSQKGCKHLVMRDLKVRLTDTTRCNDDDKIRNMLNTLNMYSTITSMMFCNHEHRDGAFDYRSVIVWRQKTFLSKIQQIGAKILEN